ncbi:MAG: hypothetical protein ACNA8J_00660 [Gammaproteobacteria bacterium]
MKKFILALITSVLVIAGASGSDEDWRMIPYADLYEAFMSAYIEGEHIKTRPAFELRGRNFSINDLRVEIDTAQGVVVVTIAEDGLADFPLDSALAAENPNVRTNAPRGGLGAAIRYSAEIEPVQQFSYDVLEEMRSEYRAAVRSRGLMARLALPRPIGLLVTFDNPNAYAKILSDDETKIEADENGYVLIPRSRTWRERDTTVSLSETPKGIVLALE